METTTSTSTLSFIEQKAEARKAAKAAREAQKAPQEPVCAEDLQAVVAAVKKVAKKAKTKASTLIASINYEAMSGSVVQLLRVKKSEKLIEAGRQAALNGEENRAEKSFKGRQGFEVGYILGLIERRNGVCYSSLEDALS